MMLMRNRPVSVISTAGPQQVLGTAARPAGDADGRPGARVINSSSSWTCPGIQGDSLSLDVERNVLTVAQPNVPAWIPTPRNGVSAERPPGSVQPPAVSSATHPRRPTRSRPATTTGCCG